MKKAKVLMQTTPLFRDYVKLEAKSKGMSIADYTNCLAEAEENLEDVAKNWNRKYKRTKRIVGFDFL
jgi:hypothetical protein